MDLGIALPTSGALATPENIIRMAQEAERMGYAAVWTYERLLRPVGNIVMRSGGPPRPMSKNYGVVFDPLETLTYAAAITSRVKLGTSIVNALFHPPVVLARRFATLDQFSGGRAIAGLGQGWMAEEFETANIPMERRGAGFDEAVAAMRACWGPDPVSYQGRFYRIPPSDISPKPVQGNLPIIIGAMTPAGVRRAARIADGLNVIAESLDGVNELVGQFREALSEAGRDPAAALIVVRSNGPVTVERLGADRPFLGGAPSEIAEDLTKLVETNVNHVLFDNEDAADVEVEVRSFAELMSAATGVL